MKNKFVKVSLLQFKTTPSKEKNFLTLEKFIKKAKEDFSPDIISLPEMWNTPYSHKFFKLFKEDKNGESLTLLKSLAKKYKVHLLAGSIPFVKEKLNENKKSSKNDIKKNSSEKIYNTSFFINPKGKILGEYSKRHLFDISIKGDKNNKGYTFLESKTLTKGNKNLVLDTSFGKIGVVICFDLRFPKQFLELKKQRVDLIFLPANFNMVTGPKHWELLIRTRAVDTQCFVLANAGARNNDGHFESYSNSLVASPDGKVIGRLKEKEGILNVKIDITENDAIRKGIPV